MQKRQEEAVPTVPVVRVPAVPEPFSRNRNRHIELPIVAGTGQRGGHAGENPRLHPLSIGPKWGGSSPDGQPSRRALVARLRGDGAGEVLPGLDHGEANLFHPGGVGAGEKRDADGGDDLAAAVKDRSGEGMDRGGDSPLS